MLVGHALLADAKSCARSRATQDGDREAMLAEAVMTMREGQRRAKRDRRRVPETRVLSLVVLDARSEAVRRRVAEQVARLDPEDEREAMRWMEAVTRFDDDAP